MFYIRARHRAADNLWDIEVWSILVSHFLLQLLCPYFELHHPPFPEDEVAEKQLVQLVLSINLFESLCKFLFDVWEYLLCPRVTGRPRRGRRPRRWWAWWDLPAVKAPMKVLRTIWMILMGAAMILVLLVMATSSIDSRHPCMIKDEAYMSEPLCQTYSHLLLFVFYVMVRSLSAIVSIFVFTFNEGLFLLLWDAIRWLRPNN